MASNASSLPSGGRPTPSRRQRRLRGSLLDESDDEDDAAAYANAALRRSRSSSRASWLHRPERPCCVCTKYAYASCLCTLVFAGVMVAVPILAWRQFNAAMEDRVLIRSAFSSGFPGWQDSANDSKREFHMYVFSVDNPVGFVQRGEKPFMSEHGPFVYRQRLRKLHITFPQPANDDMLSYRLWTTYEFDAARTKTETNGTYDSDTNVKFNVVDLFFWGQQARAGTGLWKVLNGGKNDTERMFASLTPRQIKDGYGGTGPYAFPGLQPNQTKQTDADPRTTVRVGLADRSQIQQIVVWREMHMLEATCPWRRTLDGAPYCPGGNYSRTGIGGIGHSAGECCDAADTNIKVPLWQWPVPGVPGDVPPLSYDSTYPNLVAGTDGQRFQRHPGNKVSVFVDTLSRHVVMHRTAQHSLAYVPDIALDRYEIPVHDVGTQNASTTLYNQAYFMNGAWGVQNATLLQGGAPVYITKPHFYGTGMEVRNRVEGLSPDPVKHQSFLGVEPQSGITFFSRLRLQVNVQVRTVHFSDGHGKKNGTGPTTWFAGLQPGDTYVPLAWFDERGEINEQAADEFKQALGLVLWLCFGAMIGGGGLVGAFTILSLVLAMVSKGRPRADDDESVLLDDVDDVGWQPI